MSRSLSRLPACHSLIIHLDLNPQETPVTREFYIFFNNHGTEDTVSGRSFRRFSARRTSRTRTLASLCLPGDRITHPCVIFANCFSLKATISSIKRKAVHVFFFFFCSSNFPLISCQNITCLPLVIYLIWNY